MKENKFGIEEENQYGTLIAFSFLFFVVCFIYLSVIIKYLIQYYHKKKLCVFWIDYCILIFTSMVFIAIYIVDLFLHKKREEIFRNENERIFPIVILLSLAAMCYTIIYSLLFDGIAAFQLSVKMNKMLKIKENDFFALSEKIKNINVSNIINFKNMKYYYKYYIIFALLNIVFLVICFLTYINTATPTDTPTATTTDDNPEFSFYDYFNYLLRFYHLIILVSFILIIIYMNKSKKSLLKKQYFNSNRIAQKVYDVYFSHIIYFTDIFSFKLVTDLIINIPALFFLSLEKFNVFTFILSEFVIILYIFLGGNENLSIDKICKAGKISKPIQILFCFKKIDFHFGEKDRRVIFEEFNFNYSKEEKEVINSLNITILKNIENRLIEFDNDEKLNESREDDSIFGIDNNSTTNFLNKKSNTIIDIDFKTVQEFYLIQKIIMLFFTTNKDVYESAMEAMNESCSPIKKLNQGRKIKAMNINSQNKDIDRDIYMTNINRASRLSIKESKRMKSLLKLSENDIFTSIEEKEIYEGLKNKFNLKNETYTYKIESLFSSELFELFPFYQMKINTIINSLNPTININLFKKFVKRNNDANLKNDSISNRNSSIFIKSHKNSESDSESDDDETGIKEDNKKEIENNFYYTYDLYLMYEIYDRKDFVDSEELNMIITEYNKYLLTMVKNMNYSFLPLILGIFSLDIYDLNKIIIVYRNPLYFSNFSHFNHWINYYITEEPEIIRVSSLFNEVIDVNEIEIKNGLELNEIDYDEVEKNLQNDYSFLKKIKNIYPIIHLFIGNENQDGEEQGLFKGGDQSEFKNKKNIFTENSILGEFSSANKDMEIIDVLNRNISISNYNEGSNTLSNFANENSLFDKEYYYMSGNIIRTIKIYFTHLFRRNCELNKKNKKLDNDKYLIDSESYCNFLQKQLISFLNKKSLFDDEEKDGNNDDIDNNKIKNKK